MSKNTTRQRPSSRTVDRFAIACCLVLALAATASTEAVFAAGIGSSGTSLARVVGVHFSSDGDVRRIVVELDGHTSYRVGVLSNPHRLYVDFLKTAADPQIRSKRISIGDRLISGVRIGDGQGSVTRVVLDLNDAPEYRVFELADSSGVVIELNLQSSSSAGATGSKASPAPQRQADEKKTKENAEFPAVPAGHVLSIVPTFKRQQQPPQTEKAGVTDSASETPTLSSSTPVTLPEQRAAAAAPISEPFADAHASPPNLIAGSAEDPEIEETPENITNAGPAAYGSGEPPVIYSGNFTPRNILTTSVNLQTNYSDNILNVSAPRLGDESFQSGAAVHLDRETRAFSVSLDYAPTFLLYRKSSNLNMENQNFEFDSTYRANASWSFRLRSTVLYTNGIFAEYDDQLVPNASSPSSLNETLFTPIARELSETARFDVTYRANASDSFSIYGSYLSRNFSDETAEMQGLFNTRESGGGLLFTHRLSPHDTLGVNYLFQNYSLTPGGITVVHSVLFSYGKQFSPSVTADAFGGLDDTCPQGGSYVLDASAVPVPTGQGTSCSLGWAAGGDLAKRTRTNTFQLSAQRQVSDGGGLLGLVVTTSGAATITHKLGANWSATLTGGYAQNNGLELGFLQSNFYSEFANFSLDHEIRDGMTVRMGYDYVRQGQGKGEQGLSSADFDRNVGFIRFDYRFKQLPLGR